jgi:Flp pilus assembly protein TadD
MGDMAPGRLRWSLLGSCVVLAAASPAMASDLRLVDLEGRQVDVIASRPTARATVLIFTTTDCPIANRYAPEITRITDAFGPSDVAFWLVYANPAESRETITAHRARYGYSMPALRDPQHDVIKRLGISVTPEAAVLDRQGRTLYRGRIDDRVVELGVERPAATQRDLHDALTAIVQGKPVVNPGTRAIGCIVQDFQPPTFARDIGPLIHDRCGSCHRTNGPAPFSLWTYEEMRQRASQIAAVTAKRYMPPWKAESPSRPFVGQKPLTSDEISRIQQWADAGAPRGTGPDPPPPASADGWQLGAPDLVVSLSEAYALPAEGTDVFRIFAIRLPVTTTKFVTGLEFRPGNPRVVHHANIRLDLTDVSAQLDAADPAPGYDGLMARSAVYPDGHFLGWTPGQIAPLVPANMAWKLEPGTDLVVQLHMQPSGATEKVQPSIGLYFTDEPPTRLPTILRLGSQGIDIPPGERRYAVHDSYVLPVDVELHALQPHAHYRLRHLVGSAALPDGTSIPLIEIKDWDFRWQHVYRYTQPLTLPKGTRVSMHYVYDNSADNPRNPQRPPQRVSWGQRSFDEMGDLWFQFVAGSNVDRFRLNREIEQKMTAEDIVGYETMIQASPADAELHDDVALLYLASGKPTDAVRHFRASLTLKPRTAAAHFNVATALSVAGSYDEAIKEYERALALNPNYASAHNNLGTVLVAVGRRAEGIPHFRDAVRLDDRNVQGFRNLAWHLATSNSGAGGAREAIRAAERAVELTKGHDAQMLDALAAAYAAAGSFERAVTTIERALKLSQDELLTAALRERLALYREGKPYRVP